jgi:hypothetical protein
LGKSEGSDKLEELSVDGNTTLKRVFKKRDVGAWIVLFWLRIRTGDRLL